MKTQRLVRNSDGSYDGAIGGEHQLSAQEAHKIREALSKGPKYVSQLATEVGIPVTHPAKFNALCSYVNYLGEQTGEAETAWVEGRSGKKFAGWRLSEHGVKMLEIS
jgi:hypothetical protein